ncbi:MAG: TraB/GumN family protein [Gammaproteobacteria bacterium]|nr:TraB/GumN family protein [Gammaproteobacteria bacterium]
MMQYLAVVKADGRVLVACVLAVVFLQLLTPLRASEDKNHGLLWELSKPGIEPAYLFGTIHSEDPEVLQLPQAVQQALDRCNTVVLEMLLDAEAMMYSSTAMLMMDGRMLSDIIGKPLFRQTALAIRSRGIQELVLERMKPWAAAVVLSMPASETGLVLDMMLYQNALDQGKSVHGLETVEEQLNVFEALSEKDQVLLLQDAVENFSALDTLHAELLHAYKQRDLAGLVALSEASMQTGDQQLADEFQQHLVVDRNHRMSDRMQVYLRQGRVFIAVGALHLPGEEGLLNLLEQQGFTVRRLY